MFAARGVVEPPPPTPKLSLDVSKGALAMGRLPVLPVLPAVLVLPAAGATREKGPTGTPPKIPQTPSELWAPPFREQCLPGAVSPAQG